VSLTVSGVICGVQSVLLAASSVGIDPLTYKWSTGSTSSTINAGQGLYFVTVTDANGCTDSASMYVVLPTSPEVILTVTPANCGVGNGVIDAIASNFDTLFWSGPNNYTAITTDSTVHLEGLSPGMYSVYAVNQYGCTATEDVVVGGGIDPLDEHECVFLCAPDSVYGIWVDQEIVLEIPLVTADSCPYIRFVEVVFVESDTLLMSVRACAGQSIVVGTVGVDSTSLVEIVGDCGVVLVDVMFSSAADTVEAYQRLCADSANIYQFISIAQSDTTGCPVVIEKSVFELVAYEAVDSVISYEHRCGFATDTLYQYVGSVVAADSCARYQLLHGIATSEIRFELVSESVCNAGDSVYWNATGLWHPIGTSSFLDSSLCEFRILDVNLVPKPLDSLIYGTSCNPDSVGIWFVESPGCEANIIRILHSVRQVVLLSRARLRAIRCLQRSRLNLLGYRAESALIHCL
jgi:hypothetical protein